jgi:hypothetical protein
MFVRNYPLKARKALPTALLHAGQSFSYDAFTRHKNILAPYLSILFHTAPLL